MAARGRPTPGPRVRVSKDGVALAGYALLVALFYAPLLLGQRTFPGGDFTNQFLLFHRLLRDELLAGRLPVWNPYTFAGHPFLADVQAAVFYPVSNLLLLLTAPWPSPAARLYWLQVEAVLHVLLGGFFTYLFARDLTGRRAAAFLAGVTFALSGYLTGYPPLQLSVLRTAIWLPLVLWLLWRGFEPPLRWRWWVAAAFAYAASFFAGHTQSFFLASQVILGWVALGFFLARGKGEERPSFVAYALRAAVFYLVFLGLSAAQLLPSLEFLRLSVRARVDYAYLSGGFPIQETWQMLVPGVLTEFSPLYIGIAGVGLALLALLSSMRWLAGRGGLTRERALVVLFFGGVTLFFLLLSYGGEGFLYPLLYRWVPGWALFRGQERAAYIVAFGLSVLAGQGAALLPALSERLRRSVGVGYAVLVGMGVLAFSRFWPLEGFARQGGQVLLWALLFAALLWGSWRRGRVLALVLLVVADLALSGVAAPLEPVSPAGRVAHPPESAALQAAAREAGATHQGLPGRTFNEARVQGNVGLEVRVEDLGGESPLRLDRYARLFGNILPERIWRLTGVEHVLIWTPLLAVPSTLLGEFPQASDVTYLHRLAATHPRAWVVNTLVAADDEEALRLLADSAFDLDARAVLAIGEGGAPQQPTGELAPAGENSVEVERHAPNRFTLRVRSEHGGFLVLSENWMPGWQAWRADGGGREAAPVLRANLTFLGLAVPAGESEWELVYWPTSLRIGLLIGAGTLLLLLVGGVASRVKLRRSSRR